VIISIFKKNDRKRYTNYKLMLVLSLPGKVDAKCFESRDVEAETEDGSGRSGSG